MSDYFKFRINYPLIYDKIREIGNINHINIFIDLASICRGFYNSTVQYKEINSFLETQQEPSILINELRQFLNGLYNSFKYMTPKFVVFYDDGKCIQNTALDSGYKAGNSTKYNSILNNEQLEIYRRVRKFYYAKINEIFPRNNLCSIIYSHDYELDLIPFYAIKNNVGSALSPNTFNLILSIDKDLLQCLSFQNTYQYTSIYAKKQIVTNLWNDSSAIEYIYPKFKRGILTSKHVPLLLALAGDSSDGIPNIKGIGPAHAIDILTKYNIEPLFTESYKLPDKLEPHKQLIINNLKMTSFELQILRLPETVKKLFDSKLSILG
jgi:hypothetical protein